jgi:hypothetical protein
MKFNHAKILPGFIIGTTDTWSVLGAFIRSTEAGILHTFDANVSSHIVLTCNAYRLNYGMQMLVPKINRCNLSDYEHDNNGDHGVFMANPFGNDYLTNADMQDKVNRWIWQCYSIGIKYNIEELFRFWDIPFPEGTDKIICSDLARNMLRNFNILFPSMWNSKCNPLDIQKYETSNNMLVPDGIIK